MTLAFLAALVDPIVIGAAFIGVFFARSAWSLRLGVMAVAAALSLSELIGGMDDPLSKIAASAAGAAGAGLALAECARLIVAPIAAGALGIALRVLWWVRAR